MRTTGKIAFYFHGDATEIPLGATVRIEVAPTPESVGSIATGTLDGIRRETLYVGGEPVSASRILSVVNLSAPDPDRRVHRDRPTAAVAALARSAR